MQGLIWTTKRSISALSRDEILKMLEAGKIGEGETIYPKPEYFKLHGIWHHISEFDIYVNEFDLKNK